MELLCEFKRFIVFLVTIFDYFSRVPSYDSAGWNIFTNNSTCCNNGTFADGNIAYDKYTITQPNIVFDVDSFLYIGVIVGDGFSFIVVILGNYHTFYARVEVITDCDCTSSENVHAVKVDIVSQ